MRRTSKRWGARVIAALLIAGMQSAAAEESPPPVEEEARAHQTVVTGSRTEHRSEDATVPTEVITRRQIEASGARDLGELLRLNPGIEVVHSPFNGANIRLLGLDPAYVLVLVDGERVTGRVAGTLDLSRFSLRDVERVEIVKGPASVLYGSDAIGGVINLITRHPTAPLGADAQVSYGSRGDLDARGGAFANHSGLRADVGGGFRQLAGYDLDPSSAATNGSASTGYDAGGTLEYAPSPALRLAGNVDYARRDLHGIDTSTTGAVFDRRNRTESFGASLRLRAAPRDGTDLSLRVHHSLFRDQLLQDQRGARDLDLYQDSRERIWEAGAQVTQRLPAGHLLTGGVDALWEQLSSPRLGSGIGRRRRLGLLIEDEWSVLPSPRLAVTAGVRLDLDSGFGAHPSPRLAVRYDPVPAVSLRASYGWGFRAPSFQEMLLHFENPAIGYVVEGNPDLRPELSQGLNASADVRLGEGLTFSLSAFRIDMRDLIAIVTIPPPNPDSPIRYGYGNLARVHSQGGEVSARARLVQGTWLDVGYSLTDARADTGLPLEGRAVHRGTVQLTSRFRPWGLEGTVRAAVVGPRPFMLDPDGDGTFTTSWADPYVDLDVKVSKQLFGRFNLFAGAQNLLNAGSSQHLPLAPRSFQVGLTGRY